MKLLIMMSKSYLFAVASVVLIFIALVILLVVWNRLSILSKQGNVSGRIKVAVAASAVIVILLFFSVISGLSATSLALTKFSEGEYYFRDKGFQYGISVNSEGELISFFSGRLGKEITVTYFPPGLPPEDKPQKPIQKKRSRPKGLTASLVY